MIKVLKNLVLFHMFMPILIFHHYLVCVIVLQYMHVSDETQFSFPNLFYVISKNCHPVTVCCHLWLTFNFVVLSLK